MEKIWYLIAEGTTLGPFTVEELLSEPGFKPEALVWRPGFADWVPAKDVPELAELFEEKPKKPPLDQEEEGEAAARMAEGEVILAVKKEPPYFLIWLIIAGLIFLYLAIQFYG